MSLATYFRENIIRYSAGLLSNSCDENIVKIASLLEIISPAEHRPKIRAIKNLCQRRHPVVDLARRVISQVDNRCVEKFVNNFVAAEMGKNLDFRTEGMKSGLPPLFALLISPSMRCNMDCSGCYAKNYRKKDDLPFRDLNRVVSEAKQIGVTMFVILGGEPFIRSDIFDLFKKHSDAYFSIYSNGTLIDEKSAAKLFECGNVFVNFSIEGFEKENDARRGSGSYEKVMRAMDTMRSYKLPFGYSVCVTRKNAEGVWSDKFVDTMIEKGALTGWYFLYMPVCGDKDLALMPTPKQRNRQRIRRDHIRENKPIFIVDFWNDAPYVGGCIAAKFYAHVNNYGDVEPCIFTHFSQANIKEMPLVKALNCKFFKEIRSRQPYDKNLLMPCMLIDHPHVFRQISEMVRLKATHPGAAVICKELKDDLDDYSVELRRVYGQVWEETKYRYPQEVYSPDKLLRTRQPAVR